MVSNAFLAHFAVVAVRKSMSAGSLINSTKQFALEIIRFVGALPSTKTCNVIGSQLLRAGTSVGANYRSSCRAKSLADFTAKMKVVEEECDESVYWLELLVEAGEVRAELASGLMCEASQILSMTVASIRTARLHKP
jgi:four helix bundle protein